MDEGKVTFAVNGGPDCKAIDEALAKQSAVEFIQHVEGGKTSKIKATINSLEKADHFLSMNIFVLPTSETSIIKERSYRMQYDGRKCAGNIILV